MRKFFNSKTITAIVVIVAMLAVMTACNPVAEVLPAFSLEFVDGEETITVTDQDVAGAELVVFSNESKGTVTFYKGIKVSDFIDKIGDLSDKGAITSLLVVASDDYGIDMPALPVANFENAYFALFSADAEDGEYVFLDDSNGPVRLFDKTEGTEVKSIKSVAKVIVNR